MDIILEHYNKVVKDELLKEFKYTNLMNIPKLEKIVLHRGLGEALVNKKCIEITNYVFKNITGSKPIFTKAKKSISNFKLREGDIVGCKSTLRGQKMYHFFSKFTKVVLPRVRDFQGLSVKGFDGRGNYTMGINEETLFPEIEYDKLDKTRGMDITFVTTATNDLEASFLLQKLGMPFSNKVKAK